ncbi:putative tetratricopeptide repeat protein 6 [Sciurus carolinensis]|uniref:Tetratricopeptide repeat protein 6 n=1 Tax=Sciurus carolinensis TaxID=30640 RepID=A0AA41SL52_SCICA|nr:putative tetratricopeptide repeat protein 6 [Sciurus carolinensis]
MGMNLNPKTCMCKNYVHFSRTQDISLMGKESLNTPQLQADTVQMEAETVQLEAETLEMEEEEELQISVEEPQMQSMFEELLKDMSSVFQIEQEDLPEWEASEGESEVFRSQEVSQIQTAEESSKPSEDGQPGKKSKVPKQVSTEPLQIRGKEVKRTQKSKSGIPALRLRKSLKYHHDQKLPEKILQASFSPHMHDLCTTTPGRELPIDLHLASRVYHTANKKGHSNLLEFFGSCFLDDHFIDTEKDRILYGIPVRRENEDYVSVPLVPPGTPCEWAQGTRQYAHKPYLSLLGEETSAYPELTKMFWNPTAPKFSVPESVMRDTLYPKYERAKSAVELRKKFTTKSLEIKDDIGRNLRVLMFQKRRALELQLAEQNKAEMHPSTRASIDEHLESTQDKSHFEDVSLSLVEASKKAGVTYIIYPKKKKMKWKKKLKMLKLTSVYKELAKAPKTIQRSRSSYIIL